jgi:hypothetical protein
MSLLRQARGPFAKQKRNYDCFLSIALVAMLTSCMKANTANLLPDNEAAHEIAPIHLEYAYYGARSGPAKVIMPDGEVLSGRFWPIHDFNLIDALSAGDVKSLFGDGDHSSLLIKVVGEKTTLRCHGSQEHGHGRGTCQMSNGAVYRLTF